MSIEFRQGKPTVHEMVLLNRAVTNDLEHGTLPLFQARVIGMTATEVEAMPYEAFIECIPDLAKSLQLGGDYGIPRPFLE